MTTKEFIKILQEADPSGEAHIRMDGGVPEFVELKEGYWDGPYKYIDADDRMVTTTKGMKVDVYCRDYSYYIWDDLEWNSYQETEDGLFEKLKQRFVFDYGVTYENLPQHRKDDIDRFHKKLKEDLDEYIAYKRESDQKYLQEVIDKYNKGWRFLQKKDAKWKFYDWNILNENGKGEGANWATTGPVLLSGKFEPFENGDFLEWKLK